VVIKNGKGWLQRGRGKGISQKEALLTQFPEKVNTRKKKVGGKERRSVLNSLPKHHKTKGREKRD